MAELDLAENENKDDINKKVKKFCERYLWCVLGGKGGPCSEQLSVEAVLFKLGYLEKSLK